MHVLIIHQTFMSPEEAGGTRHYELARHAQAKGHTVTIVASDTSYLSGQQMTDRKRLVTEQIVGDVRVLRAYTYPALHRSFIWRVFSFVSFMCTALVAAWRAGPVDVVMGTSPPIFQAVSAWLVAVLRRRPFLLEIRDLWPAFAIDIGVLRNPILITLSRWLERFLYARATHLLVNSPAFRDYLLARGISPAKVTLISNGVDVGMFGPPRTGAAFRQKWGLGTDFVVTYAGALGLANDLPTFLKAAGALRDLPHIRFLIVGDGKERAALEAIAQREHLSNVTFTGPYPKVDMPEVLAASDACVALLKDIPMFRTTYPNKVFDYMAAGKPTILAIDGVIRDVIEAADGGIFVPPGNETALADAIRRLDTDRAVSVRMGQAAREYVTRHFDRSRQADDFVRLLERLHQRS